MDDRSSSLFHLFGQIISIRDLVLIGGGIFLVVKGIMEILEAISASAARSATARRALGELLASSSRRSR